MWPKLSASHRLVVGLTTRSLREVRHQQKAFQSTGKEGLSVGEAPAKVKFGLVRIAAVVIPFTYLGAMASKRGAEFLEDWNIFVPEDDED